MTNDEVESTLCQLSDFWCQLHDDEPSGIDLCEESAGDLMIVHHRLTKAGVEFASEFNDYINRLHRTCAFTLEGDAEW